MLGFFEKTGEVDVTRGQAEGLGDRVSRAQVVEYAAEEARVAVYEDRLVGRVVLGVQDAVRETFEAVWLVELIVRRVRLAYRFDQVDSRSRKDPSTF